MKKTKLLLIAAVLLVTSTFTFAQRGYHNAPYERYEADKGTLVGASVSGPTTNQADIHFDASERKAVNLENGQSVEWTVSSKETNRAFNRMGIVIRYSVAGVIGRDDNRSANVEVWVDGVKKETLSVNTRYSWEALWQYNDRYNNNGENIANNNSNWRMRFDEARCRIDQAYPAGTKVKLVSQSNDLWIDFIEVESVPEPKTAVSQGATATAGSNLQSSIDSNNGKTIFIPEGTYTVSRDLWMGNANTSIVGAGMWYTNIYFDRTDYDAGGIHLTNSGQNIKDLFLNSNMKDRADGYKGIWGSTSNATIENVWVTHFETGAWFASYGSETTRATSNVTIRHCRFRNNYADGINFCQGANNNTAEFCSFRSNCDDDMAVWPAGGQACYNNTYRYCTAENNNRASSIALYGGYGNKWENIIVKDNREVGIRVNNDFDGAGFGDGAANVIANVDITRCGTNSDLFKNARPAVDINSCARFNERMQIKNVKLSCIDIQESTYSAFIQQTCNIANVTYCEVKNGNTLATPNTASCACTVTNKPVTGVSITPATFNIATGEQVNLASYVSVAPADATNKAVKYKIKSGGSFISLNEDNGTVTGTTAGQAQVEIETVDNGFITTATINVTTAIIPQCSGNVIVKTTTAPTIDGVIDAVWANAPAINISKRLTGNSSALTGFSAKWRALYDNNNVYLLVEVTKPEGYPNFFAPEYSDNMQWWENSDAIEIYFDGDNSKNSNGNTDLRAYRFRYNQSAEMTSDAVEGDRDNVEVKYATNGNRSWLIEVVIPLANVNITPTADRVIGFDVAVNVVGNASGSSRQGYFTTFATTDPPISNASQYGNVTLSECSKPTDMNSNTVVEADGKSIIAYGNTVEIKGIERGETVTVYNTVGVKVYSVRAVSNPEFITTLPQGVYLVQIEGTSVVKKVLIVR